MSEISIIIPVYNSAQYLNRCFNSIKAQTFSDFEVLLIDDGSTDNSGEICDKVSSEDSRFRTFHTQNQGSSLARRYGIERANCDKLVFIDSDDDVHPLYLRNLHDAMTQNNVDIAMCDMQKVPNDSNPSEITTGAPIILDQESLHKRFFNYQFWGFWGKIYKKELFDGIYFPPYNINEDYVVMAQLFLKQNRIAYIPNAMYYYRTNPQSQSHLRLSPRIMEEYYNKLWVLEFYRQNRCAYSSKAKAQLVESCIKLLGIIRHDDSEFYYSRQKNILKSHLIHNLCFILFRSCMPLGLKAKTLQLIIIS